MYAVRVDKVPYVRYNTDRYNRIKQPERIDRRTIRIVIRRRGIYSL